VSQWRSFSQIYFWLFLLKAFLFIEQQNFILIGKQIGYGFPLNGNEFPLHGNFGQNLKSCFEPKNLKKI
jgi:hypothetical protein